MSNNQSGILGQPPPYLPPPPPSYNPPPYNPNGNNFQSTSNNHKQQNFHGFQHTRSRLSIPFEPETTANRPIFFWDDATRSYVIPQSGRDSTPYGYLCVFGKINFDHLSLLWRNREACLSYLDSTGLENVPRHRDSDGSTFSNQHIFGNKKGQIAPKKPEPNEQDRVVSILKSLGIALPSPQETPSEDDKVKTALITTLKGLGFSLPNNSAPKDPKDERIAELESKLKTLSKPIDPKDKKIAELEALINNKKKKSEKTEKTPVEKKLAETVANQEDTIRQLQELLEAKESSWNETETESIDDNRRSKKVRSFPTSDTVVNQARARKIADLKAQLAAAQEDDDIAERNDKASKTSRALNLETPRQKSYSAPTTPFGRGRGRARPSTRSPARTTRSPVRTPQSIVTVEEAEEEEEEEGEIELEEGCLDLVTDIEANAENEETRMRTNTFISKFKDLENHHIIAFFTHYNIPNPNLATKSLRSQSNLSKTVLVLQSKNLLM